MTNLRESLRQTGDLIMEILEILHIINNRRMEKS